MALKALRRLLSDKEDTGQVFEIMPALNGDSTARNYARLLPTPQAAAASLMSTSRSRPG